MITIKRLGSSALIASCLAFAPSVHAQLIDVGAGVNGGVNVGQPRSTSSANANINLNVTATSSRATTSASVGASATTGASTSASTGTSTPGSGSMGSASVAATSGVEALVITRGDVDDESYEAVSVADVRTSSDLDAFARGLVQSDENVARVSAGSDSVSLWYKDRARLLGFIPVTVSAEARVAADGTVEVSYPWYRFLTTYNGEGLDAELGASAGSIARAEGGTSLSASAQARVLAAAQSVMSAHYQSNLDASADAESEVEIE